MAEMVSSDHIGELLAAGRLKTGKEEEAAQIKLEEINPDELRDYVRQGESVLLEAVCGAGKTEIVFEMISDALAAGKKVGMAIAAGLSFIIGVIDGYLRPLPCK